MSENSSSSVNNSPYFGYSGPLGSHWGARTAGNGRALASVSLRCDDNVLVITEKVTESKATALWRQKWQEEEPIGRRTDLREKKMAERFWASRRKGGEPAKMLSDIR